MPPEPFEFRVSGTVAHNPRFSTVEETIAASADEIRRALTNKWPLIPWRVEPVAPTNVPAAAKLLTGDPHFDPRKPVTINGYRFVPAPESQQGQPPAVATEPVRQGARYVAPPRWQDDKPRKACQNPARREGDEHVCLNSRCALRWGVDEDRPACPVAS